MKRILLTTAFLLTIVAANATLARYGIVPIGLGLTAPAGVFFAGLSFGLRDAVHEAGGGRWVLAAIAAGTGISYLVEDAVLVPGGLVPIAVASAAAFLLAELSDLAVYSPLRQRNWVGAVIASNIVGSVIDSVMFLALAFGSTAAISGLLVGKALMILPAVAVVGWVKGRK